MSDSNPPVLMAKRADVVHTKRVLSAATVMQQTSAPSEARSSEATCESRPGGRAHLARRSLAILLFWMHAGAAHNAPLCVPNLPLALGLSCSFFAESNRCSWRETGGTLPPGRRPWVVVLGVDARVSGPGSCSGSATASRMIDGAALDVLEQRSTVTRALVQSSQTLANTTGITSANGRLPCWSYLAGGTRRGCDSKAPRPAVANSNRKTVGDSPNCHFKGVHPISLCLPPRVSSTTNPQIPAHKFRSSAIVLRLENMGVCYKRDLC